MFKFMFMTRNFKGKKSCYFLQTFFKCMFRNIKMKNILDIIAISKSMEPNKCIHKKKFKKMFI